MRLGSSRFSRRQLLCTFGLATLAAAAPESAAVAIVVRSDLTIDNLSFAELRRVMLGDRQYWSSNLKVTLLVRAPGARERDVVLRLIYQMSEAQYRQYWIAKVFRAEAAGAPRIVYSNEMATELVAQIPGAISFVDASQVPAGLKVVRISGLLPGQPGYPLH